MSPVKPNPSEEYDRMGAFYANDSERSPYNALYERPAMQGLIGDVVGQHVLDVGCGSGILTEWLVDQGAHVTAFDMSYEMVRLAKASLGSSAEIRQADLSKPLEFLGNGSFDIIVSSLVLHYLSDWEAPLNELYRVLNENGRLLISTHHPCWDVATFNCANYFEKTVIRDRWLKGGREFDVHFYHRPLTEICQAFLTAGFTLSEVLEPLPLKECATLFPKDYRHLSTRPTFLFLELRKRDGRDDRTAGTAVPEAFGRASRET
jgi:2-polyprenyl-3-methyl-5-hydroxy-6-metoxy-1,4-benzoquinol methylase